MTLQELMRVPYLDGGRDPFKGLDCWGMVRAIRHHVLGLDLLPSLDSTKPGEFKKITRATSALTPLHDYVKLAKPQHGAIALAWQGKVCTHVGIAMRIDGALRIVDTDKNAGARISPVSFFESMFSRVEYYERKDLSWAN